jgi:hypothetical protein
MIFVNAWLWIFLPLAAIPIILHLLTLFRLRTVELSTFRFLFDSYVQQRRRMQFLEALLAMLRTAFLLALVAVIMRPMVKHWSDLFQGSSGGREVVILMDCSASMEAATKGKSSLYRAQVAAKKVVQDLQSEDSVTLIRVTSRSDEVFGPVSADTNNLPQRIDAMTTTPGRANFFKAFTQLFGTESPRTNPTVYIFTDCQSTGWNEVRSQGLDRILPPDLQLIVVNVGSDEGVPNQAVIGDAPRGGRAVVGLPVYLTARVVNFSKEPAEVTLITLLDEKEIARHSLSLKPGETVTKKITYIPSEKGVHRGKFRISGKTGDRFPDDDEYLFVLSVIPRIKAVVVNGSPSMDREANETLYLQALSDSGAPDEPKPDKKPAKDPGHLGSERDLIRSLDLREVPEVGLNADVLKDASVVILANCGGLNPQHFTWLRDFVAAGGGLLIFPGDKIVNPDIYNTQFFPVPGVPGEYLTPVHLGPPQGDPAKLETFERLESIDFSHPVMTVFDDPQREVPYFKKVLFYRYFPLTVADAKAKITPLAEFRPRLPAPGSPDQKRELRYALVENRFGDGRVVVAAFPVNRQWSNLPTDNGKEFVPLMLRLISWVQHRPELEVPLAVVPDGVVEISVTGAWNPAKCEVTSSPKPRRDGKNRPPIPPTTVALERSGSRLLGAFERTSESGYYTVQVRPDRPDLAGKTASLDFAVNLDAKESDFTMLDKDGFQTLLPTANVTLVNASAEAQQLNELSNTEVPIWRYLIYIMFVIIGVEFLLATLRGGRRDPEENAGVAERIRHVSLGSLLGRMTGAGASRKEAQE